MKKLVMMLVACMAAVSVFGQGRFIKARAPFEDSLAQQRNEQMNTFNTAYTKYLMVVLDHQGYQASDDKKAEALLEMADAYMGIDGLLRVEVGHERFSGKRELENGEEVKQMILLVEQGRTLLSAEQKEKYEKFLNAVRTDEHIYQVLHEEHGEYSMRIDRRETREMLRPLERGEVEEWKWLEFEKQNGESLRRMPNGTLFNLYRDNPEELKKELERLEELEKQENK